MWDNASGLAKLSPVQTGGGLTPLQASSSGVASLVAAATSVTLCFSILAIAAWMWTYKSVRSILDRISFRLLMVAMFFEFWYAGMYLFLYADPSIFQPGGKLGPKSCGPAEYFLLGEMNTVNLLISCIAVNLVLTIMFGINTIEKRLERWYIGGSIVFGFIFPFVPVMRGLLGWDSTLGNCWISGHGTRTRMRLLLVSVYLCPMLCCLASILLVTVVLVYIFIQGRATSRALFGAQGETAGYRRRTHGEDPPSPESAFPSHMPARTGPSILFTDEDPSAEQEEVGRCWFRIGCARFRNLMDGKGWTLTPEQRQRTRRSEFNSLSDKFVGIAIRIACYPVTLTLINAILIAGDLTLSAQGDSGSPYGFWFYCIYLILYGGRGTCIAILALLIDPAFVRGAKAAWKERQAERNPTLPTQSGPMVQVPYELRLDTSSQCGLTSSNPLDRLHTPVPVTPRGRMDSDASFDLFAALAWGDPSTAEKSPKGISSGLDWSKEEAELQYPADCVHVLTENDGGLVVSPRVDVPILTAQIAIPRVQLQEVARPASAPPSIDPSPAPSVSVAYPEPTRRGILSRFRPHQSLSQPQLSPGGGRGYRTRVQLAEDDPALVAHRLREKSRSRSRTRLFSPGGGRSYRPQSDLPKFSNERAQIEQAKREMQRKRESQVRDIKKRFADVQTRL
ncbi:hypothetical protein IAU60_006767 [Kwoniella sp. DSM 27419]